ncbi:MAG: spore gernimation protein KA [Thermobacillus sp. ZCTH02-B1]|uniref:spore germination protein n=1 Tax=Thermobacillus sp. ZCTH02-B1 TaxID=1858795 RepID=UPI000B55A762|nr:spore germination protein [Thermobacillus sp. ZCTH02-B1]OUM96628.1 MAG: spore gernimation protein KA [Thermobacillus sp. ZCTH02-B1]
MTTRQDGKTELSAQLAANLERLKRDFSWPQNQSLVIRNLVVAALKRDAAVLYLEGAADIEEIERRIIEPLVARGPSEFKNADPLDVVRLEIVTHRTGKAAETFDEINGDLLNGWTVLLIEGADRALLFETRGFESRQVPEPIVEHVIRGPKEAFTESAAFNRSLVRKYLRDRHLVAETLTIGDRAASEVTLMYVKDLADPNIVDEVKRRIREVRTDAVTSLPLLEQYIDENPYSLVPNALHTERPDRACAFLLEGHVILLMDNSPAAMVLPITLWSLVHSAEDHYMRWAYSNFMRIIRLLALFVAVLTPSVYIAVSTFHEEMIPSDLLLAIAATREKVPFPALLEVLLMEFAFELVREAAIRVPTVIGPTIGIVGALILGQAAVEANIISPILVVIVAITGISSFTIPEPSLNVTVRITRFILLFAGAFMGFYGIALALACILAYLTTYTSYGVPFLSPLTPHYRSSADMILRLPVHKERIRPHNLNPRDAVRRPERKSKP